MLQNCKPFSWDPCKQVQGGGGSGPEGATARGCRHFTASQTGKASRARHLSKPLATTRPLCSQPQEKGAFSFLFQSWRSGKSRSIARVFGVALLLSAHLGRQLVRRNERLSQQSMDSTPRNVGLDPPAPRSPLPKMGRWHFYLNKKCRKTAALTSQRSAWVWTSPAYCKKKMKYK